MPFFVVQNPYVQPNYGNATSAPAALSPVSRAPPTSSKTTVQAAPQPAPVLQRQQVAVQPAVQMQLVPQPVTAMTAQPVQSTKAAPQPAPVLQPQQVAAQPAVQMQLVPQPVTVMTAQPVQSTKAPTITTINSGTRWQSRRDFETSLPIRAGDIVTISCVSDDKVHFSSEKCTIPLRLDEKTFRTFFFEVLGLDTIAVPTDPTPRATTPTLESTAPTSVPMKPMAVLTDPTPAATNQTLASTAPTSVLKDPRAVPTDPTPAATTVLKVGDIVENWRDSQKAWCECRVMEVTSDQIIVDTLDGFFKPIPVNTQSIIVRKAPPPSTVSDELATLKEDKEDLEARLNRSESAEAEKSKLIKQLQSQLDAYDRERAR